MKFPGSPNPHASIKITVLIKQHSSYHFKIQPSLQEIKFSHLFCTFQNNSCMNFPESLLYQKKKTPSVRCYHAN